MLKNIKPREHVEVITYFYTVRHKKKEWDNHIFSCDENGKLERPADQERIDKLLATGDYHDDGVEKHERWNHIPGEGTCTCGEVVTLRGFTNTCDCGRDYNMSGQELAPRAQWGEETGESASDILNYDYEAVLDE